MYNFHPPLTAFPVALFFGAALLELLLLATGRTRLRVAVRCNLVLGYIGLLFAYFSGFQGTDFASQAFQIPEEAIEWHHNWGKALLFLGFPTVVLAWIAPAAEHGKRWFYGAYLVFLLATVLTCFYTGYLGGELVFSYGAGVGGENLAPLQ